MSITNFIICFNRYYKEAILNLLLKRDNNQMNIFDILTQFVYSFSSWMQAAKDQDG